MNADLLKGKIVACGHSVPWVAENMGISTSQFYRKLKSPSESFNVQDIIKLRDILGLTLDEVNSIFFSDIVA